MSAPLIAIVDYGMGNRRSVEKALERVGARVAITRDHDVLGTADGLVLPGVGAFPRAMTNLRELGLEQPILERAAAGTPLLGVCLGMQLLFTRSSELGGADGLALLEGDVDPLDAPGLRVPHIGWNDVRIEHDSALTEGLGPAPAFYHVHSLAARPADPANVLMVADYGTSFATAVQRGSIYGVQFHPEKSSTLGLRLLRNFSAVCARVAA
jgi:imidazole glycerol-phosphate synthase subunit HisH